MVMRTATCRIFRGSLMVIVGVADSPDLLSKSSMHCLNQIHNSIHSKSIFIAAEYIVAVPVLSYSLESLNLNKKQ